MQAPAIDHQAVGCVVAERFPRLEARVVPADSVAAARVVFQSEGAKDWYAVAMKLEGPAFVGVLPKPKKSLKAFRYYVEVTDKAMATARTSDFTANVVDGAAECKGKLVAGALASASVLLQVPAGVAAIPAGFAASGVAAAGGSVSGAAAAGTAAGTGGGMSTGAIVGIVAGAGAAAAGVAVAAGKASGPERTTYTGPVTGQWTIVDRVVGNVTNNCSFTRSLTGTAELRLEEKDGGVTGKFSVTMSGALIGISAGCNPPGPAGDPFGQCEVTGSVGSFSCNSQTTNSSTTPTGVQLSFTQTNTFAFSGALSGGVVTGTVSFAVNGQGTGTSPGGSGFTQQYSGSTTIPVTLR
jgi:hypothetical protein